MFWLNPHATEQHAPGAAYAGATGDGPDGARRAEREPDAAPGPIDYSEILIAKQIRDKKLFELLCKKNWEGAAALVREDSRDNALLLQWLREQGAGT